MILWAQHVWRPKRSQESIIFLELKVTHDCWVTRCGCWESRSRPLEGQSMPQTSKSSLHPPYMVYLIFAVILCCGDYCRSAILQVQELRCKNLDDTWVENRRRDGPGYSTYALNFKILPQGKHIIMNSGTISYILASGLMISWTLLEQAALEWTRNQNEPAFMYSISCNIQCYWYIIQRWIWF